MQSQIIRSLPLGSFRRLGLERAQELVGRLTDQTSAKTTFRKREPTPLLVLDPIPVLRAKITRAMTDAVKVYPELESVRGPFLETVDAMAGARSGLELLEAFNGFLALEGRWIRAENGRGNGRFTFSADEAQVYVHFAAGETSYMLRSLDAAAEDDASTLRFLASLSDLAQTLRDEERAPTPGERAAFEVGYSLLDGGAKLSTAFQSLGVTGFRPIQTWLSLADPGPGHLDVTTTRNELLRGTVVHVEHIDRDKESDKEKLEPYRLPASRHAAWVRMHVGTRSPTTAFIGRPVFENRVLQGADATAPVSDDVFMMDLLKTVHLHASASSAMFRNGIADAKIGIERMTSKQAISFLVALGGNVLRDRERQYISAAFNINTPLFVDHGGPGRRITRPMDIALAGIEIARLGGADKVTWDGASNKIPSDPITKQLTFAELVTLVHRAHESGLETYISAGMEAPDMATSVEIGVDGVGIGTSMHYVDPDSKLMGQLRPDSILEALKIRDRAAASDAGKAARLLARLDALAFEGALVGREEDLRQKLFVAVRDRDINGATRLFQDLDRVSHLEDDVSTLSRSIQRARRLLLARRDGGAEHVDGNATELLESLIGRGDSEELRVVLDDLATKKGAK